MIEALNRAYLSLGELSLAQELPLIGEPPKPGLTDINSIDAPRAILEPRFPPVFSKSSSEPIQHRDAIGKVVELNATTMASALALALRTVGLNPATITLKPNGFDLQSAEGERAYPFTIYKKLFIATPKNGRKQATRALKIPVQDGDLVVVERKKGFAVELRQLKNLASDLRNAPAPQTGLVSMNGKPTLNFSGDLHKHVRVLFKQTIQEDLNKIIASRKNVRDPASLRGDLLYQAAQHAKLDMAYDTFLIGWRHGLLYATLEVGSLAYSAPIQKDGSLGAFTMELHDEDAALQRHLDGELSH